MFIAWFMTITLFAICIYATFAIFDGLKEKDEYDLAILQVQLKNKALNDTEMIENMKQAI